MGFRAGRYEILRPIASGGMAKVYLGRAVGVGGFEREVAIKTMHPHLAEQADFVAMFLDEARVSARIHHPNVVATLDVQRDHEGIFLVMEYVDGFALHALLAATHDDGRTLPLGLTLRIFLDALAGLHAAHELTDGSGAPLEVIHRDVSPQNILVGVDGAARLTDFGIARAATRLSSTREGHLKGKLRYMAPEQLRGARLDRRVDIHAAGAVLWEMLAGRPLVSAEDEGGCLMEIARPDKESPRAQNLDVPVSIADACLRALRLDPVERYVTAAAFAEAIEDAAMQAGIVVASPREVSGFVHALQSRDPSASSPTREPGDRTATGAGLGTETVTTPTAGEGFSRPEPAPRRVGSLAAMATVLAGVAVLAAVILLRSPRSVEAAASAPPVVAAPSSPSASPPPPAASSVDTAPPPPSVAAPPSASLPPPSRPAKPRPSPAKSGAPFRPREL